MEGDGYTGAKANLNMWDPQVEKKDEFSAAKIWVISQSFAENIEAGWQAIIIITLLFYFISFSNGFWFQFSYVLGINISLLVKWHAGANLNSLDPTFVVVDLVFCPPFLQCLKF